MRARCAHARAAARLNAGPSTPSSALRTLAGSNQSERAGQAGEGKDVASGVATEAVETDAVFANCPKPQRARPREQRWCTRVSGGTLARVIRGGGAALRRTLRSAVGNPHDLQVRDELKGVGRVQRDPTQLRLVVAIAAHHRPVAAIVVLNLQVGAAGKEIVARVCTIEQHAHGLANAILGRHVCSGAWTAALAVCASAACEATLRAVQVRVRHSTTVPPADAPSFTSPKLMPSGSVSSRGTGDWLMRRS